MQVRVKVYSILQTRYSVIQVPLHVNSRLLTRSPVTLVPICKVEAGDKILRYSGPFSRTIESTDKTFRDSDPSPRTFDAVNQIFRDSGPSSRINEPAAMLFRHPGP